MKVISHGVLILGLIFLGACSSSGGDGAGAGVSGAGFSGQPQGSFATTQVLPQNDTSRYAVGCGTPGLAGSDVPQVDSRLQPGMVFDISYAQYNINAAPVSFAVENTIVAVAPTALVESMQVLSVTGIPSIQPGMTTTATYVLQSDGSFPVSYNPSVPNFQVPNTICSIGSANVAQENNYLGIFTTATGNAFVAQETLDHVEGEIFCGSQDMGNGAMDYKTVVSNSVPAEGDNKFCGGVLLFTGLAVKNSGGTLINGVAMERTSVR